MPSVGRPYYLLPSVRDSAADYLDSRLASKWMRSLCKENAQVCIRLAMNSHFHADNKGLSCLVVWRIACSHEEQKDRV